MPCRVSLCAGNLSNSLHDNKTGRPLMATVLLKGQEGATKWEETILTVIGLYPKGSGFSPHLAQQGPTLVSY